MVEDVNKKYEELFDLSKDIYKEQLDAFKNVDEKASKYFSVYVLFFGILGIIAKWIIDSYTPPREFIEWIIFIFFIATTISFIMAWWFTFSVFKTYKLKKLPLENLMITFFNNNVLLNIHYALSKRLVECYRTNYNATTKKSRSLYWGYFFIRIAFILFVVLFIMIGINKFNC